MSVYVDNARISFRGFLMSHMMADTTEELEIMADALGLKSEWIQYPGTCREHYDISAGKRAVAIKLGAVEVDSRFLVNLRKKRVLEQEKECSDVENWGPPLKKVVKSDSEERALL